MVKKITRQNIVRDHKQYVVIAVLLVVFVVLSRLLPHPPNFAPVAAIAIFAGALLPRRWALGLPLVAMIVSDLFIGLHDLVLFTWGSFALIALVSAKLLKGRLSWRNSVAASIGASVLFFVVTNFGVWLQGNMYARTLAGFVECYYMALPFFRNTLLGDMAYTLGLYGLYVLVVKATSLYRRRAIELSSAE